jgi:uncharacterized repeat protein (TIGR02543 family)
MKTIFSSMKHSYFAKIGILLIVVALVAGIVSCNGAATYELTMAENPAGGGTATDETGGSPYAEDKVVDIKAEAAPCYRFVGWTAPAGTFGDANAAVTNFTMPARDVTVTANFEPIPADHFKFYDVDWDEGLYVGKEVLLVDQFGAFNATVGDPVSFGNPVQKIHNNVTTPISDDNRHFTLYDLDYEEGWEPSSWKVMVNNQFQDDKELTVVGPYYLAVPTQKGDHEMPVCLNHYLVYEAYGPMVNDEVFLKDQFTEEWVVVDEAWYFANPVQKTIIENGEVTEIEDRDPHGHLVFYRIEGEPIEKSVQIDNQFGNRTLDLSYPELLAVPSQKISWEQPLNHFKTYWTEGWPSEPPPLWEPPLPVDVQLEDQFVTINATVGAPYLFANPVEKWLSEFEWTPIWDPKDHLTLYDIDSLSSPQEWDVWVDNQFGNGQQLRVAGPFWLAVPTGKLAPDWPADLNHYLVYVVYPKEFTPVDVYIEDQFIYGETTVYEPALFAVPAQKTHDSVVTDIKGDEHLVFYCIDGIDPLHMYNLPVVNQFGEQYLDVDEGEGNFLGVPSQKVASAGPYLYDPPF